MRVDVSCACRLFVVGARALWTFGPFPAAALIKYVLILISINMHILIYNYQEQYSYVRTGTIAMLVYIYITIHLQPAVIMLS